MAPLRSLAAAGRLVSRVPAVRMHEDELELLFALADIDECYVLVKNTELGAPLAKIAS